MVCTRLYFPRECARCEVFNAFIHFLLYAKWFAAGVEHTGVLDSIEFMSDGKLTYIFTVLLSLMYGKCIRATLTGDAKFMIWTTSLFQNKVL